MLPRILIAKYGSTSLRLSSRYCLCEYLIVGRGHLHAAEFIELEIFFMDTHPLLREEHRAGIIDLDGDHNEQIQPRGEDQP